MTRLALTIGQRQRINDAAVLTPSTRDAFLRDAEIALSACAEQPPDDNQVRAVIQKLLAATHRRGKL